MGVLCAAGQAGCGAESSSGSGSPEATGAAVGAEQPKSDVARSLGEGFVVWESNRTGDWRLWTRRLDGTGLRQLTPKEAGRQHCCPHVSPDGRWVAYLSYAGPKNTYPDGGAVGELRLVSPASGEERSLGIEARAIFENRVVVWRSPDRLITTDAGGDTVELDLAAGSVTRLYDGSPGAGSWLVNATLTHATTGGPTFSVYRADRRQILERPSLGGCQPYFSMDGRWGFWAAGAGGPLNRIELATRQVETVLRKNDARMGEGFGYAYFPMLSPDGRLFAWAASRDEHNHFDSDYEIFVAETDPRTLEVLSPAVRYSFHPGTDRYPDVFLAPLALGRHFGEAPFTVRFAPQAGGVWEWELDGRAAGQGERLEHTFERPGRYAVQARQGERTLAGSVVVEGPRPPRPVRVALRERGARLLVSFDEEILLDDVNAELESGHPIESWSAGEDGRSLVIDLASPLDRPDRLQLAGVVDRAQRPNRMRAATLEVEPPLWPSDRRELAFLWETSQAPNLVHDPDLGAERAYNLRASGLARVDRAYAMVLGGGAFALEKKEAARLREALQGSNELSLELTLRPADRKAGDVGNIVTFGSTGRQRNFALFHRRGDLFFVFRVHGSGPGADAEARLFAVPTQEASHVVVTYTPGRLLAYRNGVLEAERADFVGNFFPWRNQPLVFGDRWGGGADWAGTVEGVAIYHRILPPEEVHENHLRYRRKLERRPPVERTVVTARLERRSAVPTLEDITPYREALLTAHWQVLERHQGEVPDELRAVHWSILDGKALPINRASEGESHVLVLEPFTANPQLESLYLSDSLPGAAGGGLFFAPDPLLEPADRD